MSHPRPNTWSSIVVPWAAKLNLTPELASIKVEHILSGKTCVPISLADFEGYLTFREYSVENLQFVVWYQDYRQRFFKAAPNYRSRHGEVKVPVPNRVSIERRVAENSVDPVPVYNSATSEKAQQQTRYEIPGVHRVTSAKPSLTASTLRPTIDQRRSSQTHYKPSGVPSSAPSSWDAPDTSQFDTSQVDRPLFKQECMRIVATFLRPNSPKELNLDAIVRDAIIRDLAHSTHPDIFVHAYQEAYDMLESTSLPRFITHGTSNINWQKQLYHYVVGFILYSISISISITLIMTVNTYHKPHNRAWRLFAVPWFFTGTTTTYSSFRGFCSQVSGRGNIQLRAWELEEPADEEAKIFVNPTPRCDSRSTRPSQSAEENSLEDTNFNKAPTLDEMATIPSEGKGKIVVPFVDPDRSPMTAGIVDAGAISNPNEMAAIAPFASAAPEEKDGGVAPFVEPLDENKLPTTIIKASTGTVPTSNEMAAIAPFASVSDAKARMVAPFLEPYGDGNPSMTHPPFADPSAGKALIRPKVFGPERVVEDPRVKAVHERFMWQMYLLALYGSVVFSAIIFSVPCGHHPR